MYLLSKFTDMAIDRLAWSAARSAVDAVRYQPAHTGLLVPHAHDAAVLAVDMRGFSQLTLALDDTPYLAGLLEEYLTALTWVVECHRGVVFQYTGDGLLALFIAELAGGTPGAMLDRLVNEMCPQLHREFD